MPARAARIALGLALVAAPTLYCFWTVLFLDEQFAFRDAAHFYYPLYQAIQGEWAAGRLPLWNPWENAGMPMLGNPTAAVLYPGKLLFAPFPYAWGARVYIIAHVLLAVGAMYRLMRHWDVSRAGSLVSALAFGFGGAVLFQYCNVVFLVGAAWLPLGMMYVDALVRLRRRRAAVGLAVVLAMQTLGGDPQAAYLLGLCSAGYALGLWRADRAGPERPVRRRRGWRWLVAGALVVAWVVACLAAARWLPLLREPRTETRPLPPFPWTVHWPKILLGLWAASAYPMFRYWRRRPGGKLMLRDLGWLIAGAVIGGLLTGAQLLPVVEFSGLSVRASREATHEIYAFSVEPFRFLELLWPNFYGYGFSKDTSWAYLLPPGASQKIWIHSLYLGTPAFLFALSGLGWRGGPPWRAWLTGIAILSVLAALGTYTSPIWYARQIPSVGIAGVLGLPDTPDTGPIRFDGELRDGDGGLYWLMATALPGFESFRYPAKLLTFTTLALAGLAGFGWDRTREGGTRRATRLALSLLLATSGCLVAAVATHAAIVDGLSKSELAATGGSFGPLDPEGCWWSAVQSLVHAFVALSCTLAALGLLHWRRPRAAELAMLVILAVDLGLAGRAMIFTAPQRYFDLDNVPRVVQLIEEAEAKSPSPGPYRVHRMPAWNPSGWLIERSDRRGLEFVEWERSTIQPKYGIPLGIHYTETMGTAELFDLMFFFASFHRTVRTEQAASLLGVPVGDQVVYFTRRGFDLWNTRYFVVPINHGGWKLEDRGYAAFLPQTTPVYPTTAQLEAMDQEGRKAVALKEDFQILRNEQAFPRAWVVHQLRFANPIQGMRKRDRESIVYEMLYPGDHLWNDPNLKVFDAGRLAWVETQDRQSLAKYNLGSPPGASETVEVVSMEPSRVELKAKLDRPGVVVLADIYYPGWRLTVDGKPQDILRVNRLMRGATVEAGEHTLVYEYWPTSFLVGCALTACGLVISAGVLARTARWR